MKETKDEVNDGGDTLEVGRVTVVRLERDATKQRVAREAIVRLAYAMRDIADWAGMDTSRFSSFAKVAYSEYCNGGKRKKQFKRRSE